MKQLVWNTSTKVFLVGVLVGFLLGGAYSAYTTNMKLYNDCRYAGVTRIGEAAFKCEQFSKVVMLIPDTKKADKK
jgi:hypothetical protein